MSDPLSHHSPAIAYSCFIKVSLLAAPHVPAWHAYLHTHRHTYTCLVAIYLSCQLDLAAYLFNLFLTWMDTHIHTHSHTIHPLFISIPPPSRHPFFLSLPYFTLALATYGLTHYTFHIWICGLRIKTCLKHLMWILCHGESLLSLQSLYCSLLRSLLRLLGYRVCVFSSNDSQRLHMRAAQSQISSDSDLLAPNRVNSTMKSAGPER